MKYVSHVLAALAGVSLLSLIIVTVIGTSWGWIPAAYLIGYIVAEIRKELGK